MCTYRVYRCVYCRVLPGVLLPCVPKGSNNVIELLLLMTVFLQPPIQVISEIKDLSADLGERGSGSTIESLTVHASLTKKRSRHADVLGCFGFA